MPYDEICYSTNFLSSVIARIDFTTPINEIRESIEPEIEKKILSLYPIKEPQIIRGQRFKISPDSREFEELEPQKLFKYHSIDKSTTCSVDMNHIDIVFREYDTFEKMSEQTISIFKALLDVYKNTIIARFGLRYINEIKMDHEKNKTEWDKYINSNLIASFNFIPEDQRLSRSFHNITTISDNITVIFQYGMHNPDYPAAIKKKHFIIDIDSSSIGMIEPCDLEDTLQNCHCKSQDVFERSITDNMRSIMNDQR